MDNQRKQIVINRKFQHQYAILIVALTVFLTNLVIVIQSLLPSEQPLQLSSTTAWTIGLIELFLIIGAWYGSLKSTHKIAGPVYVITRQLKAVGDGDLCARISLREKDMFQEEAATINASLDQLQAKVETVQRAARALQLSLANGDGTGASMEQLVTGLAALRTALKD
jgi:methyl-accepting chemotaxis protein